MLGINYGEEGGRVADQEKKFAITWRSFSSADDNGVPEIADLLELDGAGYAMLIDARGIIRYRGTESKLTPILDRELEALVQEAEEAAESASK